MIRRLVMGVVSAATLAACSGATLAAAGELTAFQTQYARVVVDRHGFITSLQARDGGHEYAPAGHPSPLMTLHHFGQPYEKLIAPESATLADGSRIVLKYPGGVTAVVKAEAKASYLRLELLSLTPRGDVDNVTWGPLHTTISKTIGDMIGVVRSDDFAIGMFGLTDNTIAGPPCDSDCYGMGYYIHSPDPAKHPLPPGLKEGQWFNIGGNGVSDTAFYSHPEVYFQYVNGNGAKLEPAFGSTVAYHARDRRRSYTYCWSLLPGFDRSRPRHMVSEPVDVDFTNSAVAIYACPDDLGLKVIEQIVLGEGLPHIMIDGKWIRDPASFRPLLFWSGPYDKSLEYAKAMGFKDISRDTGEFYACLGNNWVGNRAGFSDKTVMSGPEFMEKAHKAGMTTYGGLHTLTVFLQGGISHDVTPVPSEHLLTVCRTKLAHDISATDTDIVVTDPSFLADKGTWTEGDNSNYLRIGGEMLRYDGISPTAPYHLLGVKRGHASKAAPHHAGDEVCKLMQNCYNGFVPDMQLLPDYADYYADLMARNGMESIDFDGLESLVYENQGYYAVRVFMRRLFDTYARLTGGKRPRITASNVFAGAWLYMDQCDVGGGNRMFNPVANRWGIEGKDMRNAFSNSYYPVTFGGQGWHPEWSVYDAENLEAKSIGWDATYALFASGSTIDATGEKDAILTAFHTWEQARDQGVFTRADKAELRNMEYKAHLVQTGEHAFELYRVKESDASLFAGVRGKPITLTNPWKAQPLQAALRFRSAVKGCVLTLPGGTRLSVDHAIAAGQYILFHDGRCTVADAHRVKIADVPTSQPVMLPTGDSTLGVELPADPRARVRVDVALWALDGGRRIGN